MIARLAFKIWGPQFRTALASGQLAGGPQDAKLAFDVWGADFHRALQANEMRGDGRENMVYAFSAEGKGYYTWRDIADLPPVRLKRIEEILLWVDAKTTRPTLEKLAEDVNKQLLKVVGGKKSEERSAEAAKISVLMTETLLRATHVIPEELYYQMAACCIVRDGENAKGFDEPTQDTKTAMLRAAGQAGATFFTQAATFRQLLGAWLTSEDGFRELLINWTMERERIKSARKVLGFDKGSTTTADSSTTSPSVLPVMTSAEVTS
jgi:hypothetical protein